MKTVKIICGVSAGIYTFAHCILCTILVILGLFVPVKAKIYLDSI